MIVSRGRCDTSSQTPPAGVPRPCLISVYAASETRSRVDSSIRSGSYRSMKRSPSPLRRIPPSPLAASETSVPAALSGAIRPDGWNCTSSASRMRQPARTARRKESPVFSSRREEVRRQIRVCPPVARITASAWMTYRLPSARSNPYAPNTVPSRTSRRVTYTVSRTGMSSWAARLIRVRWISSPV
ncbi:hypothetical protein GCM10020220_029530 [Nonomuraea rubra]